MWGDPIYLAAAIALFVSVMFGLINHLQNNGLDHVDAPTGTVINVGTSALAMWIFSPLYFAPHVLFTPAAAYFAIAGLVVPGISLALTALSIRRLGPSFTAGVASTSPVFAMVLAIVFIGESATSLSIAGTLVVAAGVTLLAGRNKNVPRNWPLWALLLPLGAALARAISHAAIKLGLTDQPHPFMAALIAATISITMIYTFYRLRGNTLPPINPGYAWFAACGLINALGLSLLNLALDLGEVIVVSPLIAAAPVFTLLASYLYFRRERITTRMTLAILSVFAGCVMVIIK